MAIRCETIQSAAYERRTSRSTTGDECMICGQGTKGRNGALHVAIDHTVFAFVTDAEAAQLFDDVSLFPIGPECVKKWRKAIGPDATAVPLTMDI